MAEDRLEQRERVFQQYKRDVKERGKPFYPYAMFHDTLMSFVVAVVIIGLAVVWKWTTPGHHTGFNLFGTTDHPDQAGWLGKLYDEPADPGRSASSRGPIGTSTSSSICSGSSSGRTR